MEIPLEMISDDKGYIDRQCPNEECEYVFKVHLNDWKEKFSDEEIYCPMCGYVADSGQWWTYKQLDEGQEIAINYAQDYFLNKIDKTLKNMERETKNNSFVEFTYKTSKRNSFVNNPIGQREEWAIDIICIECNTRYSVIGNAYFCPCCKNISIEYTFEVSLESILKMIKSNDEIYILLEKKYGKDLAVTTCRAMIEGSIGDIISAFQKFAEVIFKKQSLKNVRVNDFQIIEKGSQLFKEHYGKGYDEWLTENEIEYLNLMFQRRHILEHNNGIIDERYLEKSKDMSYKVGQRVIIKENDVIKLLDFVKKLGKGLLTL